MNGDGITRRTAIALTGAVVASVAMPCQIAEAGTHTAMLERPRVSLFSLIFDEVTLHYGATRDEIFSDDRSARVVRPRQVAMYLAFMLTGKSLPEIGRRIGGRDHTTVLHACRKIEALRQSDPVETAKINRHIVHCVRAMRENAIALDPERYAYARWFLKAETPRAPPWRAERRHASIMALRT